MEPLSIAKLFLQACPANTKHLIFHTQVSKNILCLQKRASHKICNLAMYQYEMSDVIHSCMPVLLMHQPCQHSNVKSSTWKELDSGSTPQLTLYNYYKGSVSAGCCHCPVSFVYWTWHWNANRLYEWWKSTYTLPPITIKNIPSPMHHVLVSMSHVNVTQQCKLCLCMYVNITTSLMQHIAFVHTQYELYYLFHCA